MYMSNTTVVSVKVTCILYCKQGHVITACLLTLYDPDVKM